MKRASKPMMASADIVILEGIGRRNSYGTCELTRIPDHQKAGSIWEKIYFIYSTWVLVKAVVMDLLIFVLLFFPTRLKYNNKKR
jgi:hypothetical protein